jgi:hypothetical protein
MSSELLQSLVNLSGLRPKPPHPIACIGAYIGRMDAKNYCWEIKSTLRDECQTQLYAEIENCLQGHFGSIPNADRITISFYMIGKSPQTAFPTIVFISENAELRKNARKALKSSEILSHYPAFKTAHSVKDPGFQKMEQLASNTDPTKDLSPLMQEQSIDPRSRQKVRTNSNSSAGLEKNSPLPGHLLRHLPQVEHPPATKDPASSRALSLQTERWVHHEAVEAIHARLALSSLHLDSKMVTQGLDDSIGPSSPLRREYPRSRRSSMTPALIHQFAPSAHPPSLRSCYAEATPTETSTLRTMRQPAAAIVLEDVSFGAEQVTKVWYDSTQPVRTSGMTLYIRHPFFTRTTTANAIQLKDRIYFQMVLHPFLEKASRTSESSSEDDEFEIDSGTETDNDSIDQDVVMTSTGSITPEMPTQSPEIGSGSSDCSSELCRLSDEPIKGLGRSSDPVCDASNKLADFTTTQSTYESRKNVVPVFKSLSILGKVVTGSISTDWALIKIEDPQVEAALQKDRTGHIITMDKFAQPPKDNVAVRTSTASHGPLTGVLSAWPSLTRLPCSNNIRKVYVVRFDGALADGDCGSVVVSVNNDHVYGHLVAGCRQTGYAYIMAASEVAKDIEKFTSRITEDVTCQGRTRVIYECVFWFLACGYVSDNKEEWMTHCESHFRGEEPPLTVQCPLCDWAVTHTDGHGSWRASMQHLACEHTMLGQTLRTSRLDLNLYHHLWRRRLIDDQDYKELLAGDHNLGRLPRSFVEAASSQRYSDEVREKERSRKRGKGKQMPVQGVA